MACLSARGNECFILRIIPNPTIEVEYSLWNKNDVMIKAWIMYSVSNALQGDFAYM